MFTKNDLTKIILLLITIIPLTACAPRVAPTPISSTATSIPTTEVLPATPTMPTPDAAPTLEAPPLEFKGHTGFIYDVDISPDGKYLATGSTDQTARLWDLATGETIRVFSGHTGEVGGLAFSPDGKYLVTGSFDRTVRLWDVASGQTVEVFSGHTAEAGYVEFSPDGKNIVSAAGEPTARIWEVANGQTVHLLTGHSSYLTRVAYSPDGRYVLTGSGDDTARLWDAVTGNEVRVFTGHSEDVSAVAFSPDGKYIATGDDHTARLWEVATGQMVREFSGHQAWVSGIEFSPDGQLLLTGSGDRTARLWEVATGQTIRVFRGIPAVVQDVTFSPDGRFVVAAGDDRIARVWSLQTSSVAAPAQDKSGTITLRLAVADAPGRPSEPYVLEFIEQVKTLSNGNITIEPIWQAGDDTSVGFESGVIQHVIRGGMELGLAGSRAFDTESVMSFQALQAPFLITNDALSKAVATSDIATRMLDSLSSAGVVGLTLWPEDLRHPFSLNPDKPLLAPDDFAGLNIRATPSGLTYLLIDTLGGSPMFGDTDYQGAESGLRQGYSLTGKPTATGNVVFFPKFQVLFVNGAAFEKLSDAQRAVLREAAVATQKKAIAEHPSEVNAATAWCADGGTIVLASDAQVAAFGKAAQPVFDLISQDPLNAELIAAIRQLKVQTEPSATAIACGPAVAGQSPKSGTETEVWSQGLPPNGVWQVELTADDFVQRGVLQSTAAEMAGVYTWTFQDGKAQFDLQGTAMTVSCQADYRVIGDAVRLDYAGSATCDGNAFDDVQWRLDTDGLHFHLVGSNLGLPVELRANYEAKPWQKLADQ